MIKYLLTLLLLLSINFAFNASSASYSIGSYHIGSAGNNASSPSFDSRFTLTYEQPGNRFMDTTNYIGNLGWFQSILEIIPTVPGVSKVIDRLAFDFIWRVNRDQRRTRILTGIANPR